MDRKSNKGKFILGLMVGLIAFKIISSLSSTKEQPLPPTTPGISNFDEYLVHSKHNSNLNELTTAQKEAYAYYAAQDFDKAIPLLENLCSDACDPVTYYYLGIAYYFANQDAKAEEILSDQRMRYYKLPI